MASVKLQSVTKKFREITAVNKMDIEIKDGEFFILLGPTGAGKTTTLRIVSGLEKADEGDVLIDNVIVNNWPPANRDVAFIFQYYSLYPNYTVKQNLEFPLKANIRKTSKDEIEKKVNKVAKVLHIEHLLDRRTEKLSGGEMQRVAIGRAIVRQPKIFLMDEPLSNLDAKLREEMRVELKRLQVDMRATIFFVTHDQIEAMTMGDRIAILNKGNILQTGTPDEIYNDPDNLLTATFIGSPAINVLDAMVNTEKFVIEQNIMEYKPTNSQKESLVDYKGKKVYLCIRPEDIEVIREATSDNSFKCEVYGIENMGMEDILRLKAGNNIIKAITPPAFLAKIGDIVSARFIKNKIYFFDIDTKKRIR